jgi:hypothetical protein
MNSFLHRPNAPHRPSPRAEAGPLPISLPPLTAKRALAPSRSRRQPLAVCVGPAYQERLRQIPLPCSRVRCHHRQSAAVAPRCVALLHVAVAPEHAPPAARRRCATPDAQSRGLGDKPRSATCARPSPSLPPSVPPHAV